MKEAQIEVQFYSMVGGGGNLTVNSTENWWLPREEWGRPKRSSIELTTEQAHELEKVFSPCVDNLAFYDADTMLLLRKMYEIWEEYAVSSIVELEPVDKAVIAQVEKKINSSGKDT